MRDEIGGSDELLGCLRLLSRGRLSATGRTGDRQPSPARRCRAGVGLFSRCVRHTSLGLGRARSSLPACSPSGVPPDTFETVCVSSARDLAPPFLARALVFSVSIDAGSSCLYSAVLPVRDLCAWRKQLRPGSRPSSSSEPPIDLHQSKGCAVTSGAPSRASALSLRRASSARKAFALRDLSGGARAASRRRRPPALPRRSSGPRRSDSAPSADRSSDDSR